MAAFRRPGKMKIFHLVATMPSVSRRARTHGFSMLEVLTALAIIAVLTAVLLPALNNKLQDSRSTALEQTFLGLSQGIAEFKRATTRYPSTLLYLTTQPNSTPNTDVCGNILSSTAALWRGPYVSRDVPSTGIQMGDAVIPPGLTRVMNASNTVPLFILITGNGVESSTVDDMESDLDGLPADANNGTIRWVAGSTTTVRNVSYAMPVNSC